MTMHESSTQAIPHASGRCRARQSSWMATAGGPSNVSCHVAGHKRGVESVRETVKACGDMGVEYLTLFAFSSENWRRPEDEVSVLMQLFIRALENEVVKLHNNGIRSAAWAICPPSMRASAS